MNKNVYNKIAASIAVIFSLLTIVEGTKVLLGITIPEYIVLTPLLIYNITMGVFGLFVGTALWIFYRWSLKLTIMVAAAHFSVLLIVAAIYLIGGTIASHSVNAMIIRTVIWGAIVLVAWKTNQAVELK